MNSSVENEKKSEYFYYIQQYTGNQIIKMYIVQHLSS